MPLHALQPPLDAGPCTNGLPRLLRLDALGRATPSACRALCDATSPLHCRSSGVVEVDGDAITLSRLLRRAREQGQAWLALHRPQALPASLRCRHLGDGFELELYLPEDSSIDQQALREMFAFTPSEALVAAGLCDGRRPADLAAALGIQLNTVQSHIKRALAKTGCRRQAELVALLLRSAAHVRGRAVASPRSRPSRCALPPHAPAGLGSPAGDA